MKKLMFAAAAMAAGVVVADGIASANVVGYQSYDTTGGTGNIAPAFEPVNNDKEWTLDTKIFDTDVAADDQVQVLNYDLFALDAYGFLGFDAKSGESKGWMYMSSDIMTGEDVNVKVASFKVAKGQVTYCTKGDYVTPITTAGQVADLKGATVQFDEPGTYDFANPFPVATTLADLQEFFQTDDQIQVMNFDLFDFDSYQYLGADKGWLYMSSDVVTGDPIDKKVSDLTKVILPAGQGGYFSFSKGTRTWNVTIK